MSAGRHILPFHSFWRAEEKANRRHIMSERCCWFWFTWKPQLTVTADAGRSVILVRLNQIIRYARRYRVVWPCDQCWFVTYSFSFFSNAPGSVKNQCVWFGRPQIAINLIPMKQDNTTNTQSHLTRSIQCRRRVCDYWIAICCVYLMCVICRPARKTSSVCFLSQREIVCLLIIEFWLIPREN